MATKPTELFINASWNNRRKVPKTTPYGVELRFEPSSAGATDRNAFQTLEDAQNYARTRELPLPVIYHTYDKSVAIDNASKKLGNIRSQEIKSTVDDKPAKWSWSGKSKIVASATITVTDTAQNNLDIAGFQNVTLRNRSNNSGKYTVHGGSNTVAHSFVVTGANTMKVTHKDSATIRGIATGVLTVSKGAHVTKADGAWAEAASVSAGIASDNSAFIPSDPGLPAYADWGTQLMDSPLKTGLPGYSRVILDVGAKADVLYGGWMSYDHISDATYSLTNPSMIKSCNYQTNAVGMLFVSGGATVGSAYNYSTAVISGGNFTLLQGGNTQIVGKTTYSVPNASSYKETSEHFSSSTATGTAILSGLASKSGARDVSGYATVSIIDTALDSVNAAGYRLLTKETEEKTTVNGKPKITYTYTDSKNYSQTGELSNPKGKVGGTFHKDVVGFGKVNLTGATFNGKLAAVVFEAPTEYYPDQTYFYASGNYSSTVSRVSSAGVKVQDKLNEKFTCTALGGVTLSASEVGKGIQGYRTVNLTNVKVGLGISAGGTSFDESSNDSRSLDGSISSSLTNWRNSTTAIGTLNMSGGVLSGGDIYEFATVTLNGVLGNVGRMDALNWTASRRFNYSSGGALLEESYVSRYAAGVGQLTVNQGDSLKIKGINGYNKIAMTGGSITNGIDQGWVSRSYDSSRASYDSKAGTSKFSSNFINSSAFAGVVQLKSATVAAGGIYGYQKVTLDDSIVSGGIGRLDKGSPAPGPSPAPVPVDPVIYAPNFSSRYESAEYDNGGTRLVRSSSIDVSSSTATLELTLARGANVYGDVIGAKTIATSNGGIAQISGNVDMSGERKINSSSVTSDFKKGQATTISTSSYLHSATGTLTANGLFVTGDIVGAAKVTASVLWAGDIDGTTTSTYYKATYGIGNSGAITQITGSSSFIQSATGAATLTSGAVVGDLLGFGNVTAKEGVVIGNANGWTDKEVRSFSLTSNGGYASTTANHDVGNSFSAKNAHVSGGIFGYKSIVLEGYMTTVDAGIDAEQHKDSLVLSNTAVSGSVVGQNLTREHSNSIMGEITLKNAAQVKGGAYGIRVANLTSGGIVGEVAMSGWSEKETNKLTSNTKTKLFEQNWQVSSGVAGGALTLNKGAYISTDAGNALGGVYGAANVTVTDGDIEGDVYGCGKENYSSSIVAKGTKIDSVSVLTEDTVNIDSESAVEWTEKYLHNNSAAGTFKLTGGFVDGAIENFATVQLRGEADYTSVGRAKGGAVVDSFSHVYKDGSDIYNSSYRKDVLGTLTATNVTFTDGSVLAEGFATVTLTGCTGLGGSIWGGNEEEMRRGVGEGANFAVASRAATGSAGLNGKYTAAGLVTLLSTELNGGSIINCATVTLGDCSVGNIDVYYSGPATLTLNGSNNVGDINGVTSLTVRNGVTNAGNCTGTAGNDNFTVNAGAALNLESCDFGSGSDKAVVNGLARLFGEFANTDQLAFSGNGNVAVTERNYITIQRAIASGTLGDVTFSGGIELINAGANEDLLYAIRTKKEELADNTAKGAVKFAGGDLDGWLSGEEDADLGKFADTADWIKFKYDDDCDYSVALMDNYRHNDVQVEIWKGSQLVDVAEWDNGVFEIDNDDLKNGVEYQLAIKMTNDSSALRYTFMAVENA